MQDRRGEIRLLDTNIIQIRVKFYESDVVKDKAVRIMMSFIWRSRV